MVSHQSSATFFESMLVQPPSSLEVNALKAFAAAVLAVSISFDLSAAGVFRSLRASRIRMV